jgi:hypothetical protein
VIAALVLEHEQLTLDGADRLLRYVPVLNGQRLGVLRHVGQDRAQVLHVE